MARTKGAKARKNWIDADDVIFTKAEDYARDGYPYYAACAFLQGFVNEREGFRVFRPNSKAEGKARAKLVEILGDFSQPVPNFIRKQLVSLFRDEAHPYESRQLVFEARNKKRHANAMHGLAIATAVCWALDAQVAAGIIANKGEAERKAMKLCGAARDTVKNAFSKYGEQARVLIAAIERADRRS